MMNSGNMRIVAKKFCLLAHLGGAPDGPHQRAPLANDRFEWFFTVHCPIHAHGDRRARRAGGERLTARSTSGTAWWMEEYGFGPHFLYGEHGGDEVVIVYKVYLRMAHR
ncbi:hypothetical protein PR202_ga19735 [Eleusine coracana subsp. coracana]|uniref:Uncharacterized protein n=1 Tax=Eleusine coracana subsp. coracana TaxID=191504 RepID=A0AAV5CWE8_ELECO|nr:hypothetical protein PR202_ga19735 [Eleusine coracana subsp. coracana]